MNEVEQKVDKKRDLLIMEEFRRLAGKVVADHAELDNRIKELEKRSTDQQFKDLLDTKLDKIEFSNFVNLLTEETIGPIQKEIDKAKKDIVCIESFLGDLAQMIKNLE